MKSIKIFAAGASGAIRRPLIERFTRDGHEVTGMIRPTENGDHLRQFDADPVGVDAFDRNAVRTALERAQPAVVINQLTSLPKSPADLGTALPADRKLRIEGGGNLFAASSGSADYSINPINPIFLACWSPRVLTDERMSEDAGTTSGYFAL